MKISDESEDRQLETAVLRLNSTVHGLVFGLACGGVIFLATVFLVIKGGPVVGPHLMLLGVYFPGYTVTFAGSLIGFAYGFALGFVAGWLTAWIYNRVALFRAR